MLKTGKRFLAMVLALMVLLLAGCGAEKPEETKATEASKSPEQILAERRDIAEEKMRWALSVLWRAEEDITYSRDPASRGPENDDPKGVFKIVKGRVYQGLPYAHSSGSVYSFLSFSDAPDSNGVYSIGGITQKMLNGYPTGGTGFNISRISSDCADTIFWAWGHVATSIFFDHTSRMTEMTGCLKVGEYAFEGSSYVDTIQDCENNGLQTMCAAYAQLQKADAVVMFKSEGHTMMVADVHVVKNGDTIDPEQSYIMVIDQISSNLKNEVHVYNEQLQEDVYLCGRLDAKFTFQKLYNSGYLPITCKEFQDPAPLPEETVTDSEETHTKDTIFKGVFQSPYRISSVTVTITDKEGNVVQQLTGFSHQAEMMRFRLPRMISKEEAEVVRGSIDLDALAAGTYRCTHICQIATGKEITVRDFEFTV